MLFDGHLVIAGAAEIMADLVADDAARSVAAKESRSTVRCNAQALIGGPANRGQVFQKNAQRGVREPGLGIWSTD